MIVIYHETLKFTMKIVLKIAFLCSTTLLGACVYRADTHQGAPVHTRALYPLHGIKIGMTPAQVISVAGSPQIHDNLAPNRWDYVYYYTAGTQGKKDGKTDIAERVSVYFKDGVVSGVEGLTP